MPLRVGAKLRGLESMVTSLALLKHLAFQGTTSGPRRLQPWMGRLDVEASAELVRGFHLHGLYPTTTWFRVGSGFPGDLETLGLPP